MSYPYLFIISGCVIHPSIHQLYQWWLKGDALRCAIGFIYHHLCVNTPSLGSSIFSIKILYIEFPFSILFCPILVWFNFIFNFHFVICFSVSLSRNIVYTILNTVVILWDVSQYFPLFVALIFFSLENSGVIQVKKKILKHTHNMCTQNECRSNRRGIFDYYNKEKLKQKTMHTPQMLLLMRINDTKRQRNIVFFSLNLDYMFSVFSH